MEREPPTVNAYDEAGPTASLFGILKDKGKSALGKKILDSELAPSLS